MSSTRVSLTAAEIAEPQLLDRKKVSLNAYFAAPYPERVSRVFARLATVDLPALCASHPATPFAALITLAADEMIFTPQTGPRPEPLAPKDVSRIRSLQVFALEAVCEAAFKMPAQEAFYLSLAALSSCCSRARRSNF